MTTPDHPSIPNENKGIVERFHHRLWGDGDASVIDEVVAPDAVTHWGDSESNTIEAMRADVERYFAGFTDVSTGIDDLLGDDDKVVLRWSTTGRHTGPYGKVAPTGKTITMEGVDVYRLAGGRIVEAWSMWDGLSVYQQLGLVADDVGP
ncbi:ester cyclase [Desertimonas flava]|uniref:ester cyclase n=1 Tax=Desertimonas flava TaxID=2064846 RepID=UPI0013C418FB|nr:ester cyclase [Desertimonas flava]